MDCGGRQLLATTREAGLPVLARTLRKRGRLLLGVPEVLGEAPRDGALFALGPRRAGTPLLPLVPGLRVGIQLPLASFSARWPRRSRAGAGGQWTSPPSAVRAAPLGVPRPARLVGSPRHSWGRATQPWAGWLQSWFDAASDYGPPKSARRFPAHRMSMDVHWATLAASSSPIGRRCGVAFSFSMWMPNAAAKSGKRHASLSPTGAFARLLRRVWTSAIGTRRRFRSYFRSWVAERWSKAPRG